MNVDNYFQLQNPEELHCSVWLYQTHHSFMKIQVHKGDFEPFLWLDFDGVGYFEGPMQWQGANFMVMKKEYQLHYHEILGHTRRKQEERLLEDSKLFFVSATNENLQIKILARDGKISYGEN